MPAQTLSTPYLRRSSFEPSDFLIGQKENEVRYVPSSLVPSEIVGNIYSDRLDLIFRYMSEESPLEKKFRRGDVEIEIGKYTQKILSISLSFKPRQSSLMASIDEAIKAVKAASTAIDRRSIQKSYSLILDVLDDVKRDFKSPQMKQDLELQFRRGKS